MNSFIIVSQNPQTRTTYLDEFRTTHAISPFDQTVITSETPSIGIEIIRDMQKTLYFKPLKGEKKVVVIEQAHTITPEAQNALLKTLEEPPLHTYFFLSTDTINAFLPTIVSRCKVVTLEEEHQELDKEARETALKEYEELTKGDIAQKLLFAEKLAADKQRAQEWIKAMIYVIHENLLADEGKQEEYALFLSILQQAYTTIQTTNVNLRLLLEHTFLSLP